MLIRIALLIGLCFTFNESLACCTCDCDNGVACAPFGMADWPCHGQPSCCTGWDLSCGCND